VREELTDLSFNEIIALLETRRLNDFTLPIPKELHKMLNFILDNGKYKTNIFLNPGNAS
jgi:hypothetical protein